MKTVGPGRVPWCPRATLALTCLTALSGCGNSADANSSMDGAAGVASGGGASGNGASGGGAKAGTSGGGSTGSGGAGMGGSVAGAPGSAGRGGATSSGGSSGSATGGARSIDGGGDAGGSSGGDGGSMPASRGCTNPAHVLPLNPSNPQDGVTLGGFYVDTDTWNAANYEVTQTMYVCDYGSWYAIANMNDDAHDGAVKTYPNVHQDFGGSPQISSFGTISSSFAHKGPHVGIYEFAYDIWLNGIASAGSTEVMIWTDNYKQVPSGSSLETVTFDGEGYKVYKSGNYIAFVETSNVMSGTVNLLSFFNHVIAKGWIGPASTLGAIDYGVELVSTDGADARFEVNAFTLTAK